jgi:hypothetical protein
MQFPRVVDGLIARQSQELNLAHSDISRLHDMLLDAQHAAGGHQPGVLAAALVRLHTKQLTVSSIDAPLATTAAADDDEDGGDGATSERGDRSEIWRRWQQQRRRPAQTSSAICAAFNVSPTAVRVLCERLSPSQSKADRFALLQSKPPSPSSTNQHTLAAASFSSSSA